MAEDQLAKDCQNFLRGIFEFKRRIRSFIFRKQRRQDELAATLELKLEDAGLHLGLPATNPVTIAAVAYLMAAELERKKAETEEDEARYHASFSFDNSGTEREDW